MKKRLEEFLRSKTGKGLALGLAVSLLVLLLKFCMVFHRLDYTLLNIFYQNRSDVVNHPDVSVWTIHDDDLELARWPWAWDKFAVSYEMLERYDAGLGVVMESAFDQPGAVSMWPEQAAAEKAALLAASGNASPEDMRRAVQGVFPDSNERFVRALRAWPRSVLAQQFVIPDDQDPAAIRAEMERRKARFIQPKKDAIGKVRRFGVPWPAPGRLLQAMDLLPLTPELSVAAAGVGFSRIVPDDDGVVRRSPTVVWYDGTLFFSQAVVAAALHLGCPVERIEVAPGRRLLLPGPRGGGLEIPIDERGLMWINWTGEVQMKEFRVHTFSLVRTFLLYDIAKGLVAGRDFSGEAAGAFLEQYPRTIQQMGLATKEKADRTKGVMLLWWLTETCQRNGQALAEAVETKYDTLGDGLDALDQAAVYEQLAFSSNLAARLKQGQDPGDEALLKELGIDGRTVTRNFLLQEIGADDLKGLVEKGFVSVHPGNMQGTKDVVLRVERAGLGEEALAKALVAAGLAANAEEAGKKKLFLPFQAAELNRQSLLEAGRLIRVGARKGNLDKLRPLMFHAVALPKDGGGKELASPGIVTGKAVFMGLTATGLNAQNPTPYAQRDTMVGLVPAMFNTIVTGRFIRPVPWTEYACVLAYALLVAFLTLSLRIYFSFPLVALLALAHYAAAFTLFEDRGLILAVNTPLAAVFLAFVGALLYDYWEQLQERKKVRGMFAAMVSPQVLKMMEEDPDKFNLQGVKMEASMFSSDVSGFTTISEGVTAEGLARILNLYLTPMSNLVMIYDGYVEKYEGDAIKADFGLPVADPQHAWKACYSAVLQQEELKVVQRMLLVKYGVKISARMGVNTGIVSAGNMGSENKMQYCALGEAVAMAEEFEPSNKMYESWIATGPETKRQAADWLVLRHLDNVIYHHETLALHEVLGWKKERFLAHWEGKPIPELVVEGWERIIPDKILAYLDYYRNRKFPGMPFYDLLMASFVPLEEPSIELLKLEDELEIHDIEKDWRELLSRLQAHDLAAVLGALVPVDRDELARLEKDLAAAGEPWKKTMAAYQLELRRRRFLVATLLSKVERKVYDDLERVVDALEKRVVCLAKRMAFPTKEDRVGTLFAGHLKELLARPADARAGLDPAPLRARCAELSARINAGMKAFIEKAKAAAPDYHRFMAEHGVVPETKLRTCALFAEGRELYLARRFEEAIRKFEEGLAITPDDGPCRKFVERAQAFLKAPPPADWNGDWTANW